MFSQFRSYKKIDRNVLNLVVAESFVQLVNITFMLLLLIYMHKNGYEDYESAHYMKFRFLGVIALAIPIGIYIRRHKIKPMFLFGALMVPLMGIAVILSIKYHITWLIYVSHVLWGIGYVCIQVTAVPFVLRHADAKYRTEALSLIHSTWSLAGITAGIIIFSLAYIFPAYMNEEVVMLMLTGCGFMAFYFAWKINVKEVPGSKFQVPGTEPLEKNMEREKKWNLEQSGTWNKVEEYSYDWGTIMWAMTPTTMIAIGAGLTVPFISLFFYKIYGVDSEDFSLLNTAALLLVAYATLMVPNVKRSLGYRLAIPITQGVSIMALVGLASTELFSDHWIAVYVAAFFFICRQPLMSMAQPMTTEVTMAYVGEKNREMVSALTAAVWSGSWFVSAIVFEEMRKVEFKYSTIFLVTAGFYAIGVILYYFLTVASEKQGKI